MNGSSEEMVHNCKISKVDRYGWEMKDAPGKFLMIHKNKLEIDDSYQRDTESTEKKIGTIASNWSWTAFGAISVAYRNGRFYVIDGQHRMLAARRRIDITSVPCMVFSTSNAKEEAQGFLDSNTLRKAVTAASKFKASIVTEDEVAIAAARLVERSGRVVSNSSGAGTIGCIARVQRLLQTDAKALDVVWPLLVGLCHGHPLHERLLDGLFYIQKRMPEHQSLSDKDWSKRLFKCGYEKLLGGANRAAAFKGAGGAKIWADGIVDEINRGCRNKLELT